MSRVMLLVVVFLVTVQVGLAYTVWKHLRVPCEAQVYRLCYKGYVVTPDLTPIKDRVGAYVRCTIT